MSPFALRRAGAAAVVLMTGIATDAQAEESAPARAQALFDRALAHAKANRFREACPLFRASQDAEARTGTAMNLATCYEKTYRLASAWAAYREAVSLASREGNTEREEAAQRKVNQLEPQLPRLRITVSATSRVSGLTVTRDGIAVPAAEWNVPIPVDHGPHVIAARAPQLAGWQKELTVRDSQTLSIPKLVPLPWWTTGRIVGASLAAAGIVSAGTGLVLGLVANASYDDTVSSFCSNGNRNDCRVGANDDAKSAYGLATTSTVLTIAGGALAVGGGALVLFARPHDDAAPEKPRGALGPTRVVLRGGPTWVGLAGQF